MQASFLSVYRDIPTMVINFCADKPKCDVMLESGYSPLMILRSGVGMPAANAAVFENHAV